MSLVTHLQRLQHQVPGVVDDERLFEKLLELALADRRAAGASADAVQRERAEILELHRLARTLPSPTPTQSRSDHAQLTRLANRLEDAAATLALPSIQRPILGTVPAPQVAAKMRVAAAESLIVFATGLLVFCQQFAKMATYFLTLAHQPDGSVSYSTDENAARRVAENDKALRDRFEEVLVSWRTACPAPYRSMPFDDRRKLASILSEAMKLHVMAHEYGHLWLHHGWKGPLPTVTMTGPVDAARVGQWEEELGADWIGLQLVMAVFHAEGIDKSAAIAGVDLLGTATGLLEELLALVAGSATVEIERHPPSPVRQAVLRLHVERHVPAGLAQNGLAMARSFEAGFARLWELGGERIRLALGVTRPT
jgi:hypothetical protein